MHRLLLVLTLLAAPVIAGEAVPDFTFTDLRGNPRTLSQLQSGSRPLMLVFWCSTCHSCRDAEARVDELRREFAGKADVVAVDANRGESPEAVQAALDRKSLAFPVVFDSQGRLADHFGIKATTSTLLLDGQRNLRYLGSFGTPDQPLAQRALEQLLAGGPVEPSRTKLRGCVIRR
ncbi:MAG: redoxin domain-containing protein [Candidatus Eremiobacterota bacterium]